ncbi:hypothetical protein ACNQTW_04835, partial [Corynebacterium diphtheriae]
VCNWQNKKLMICSIKRGHHPMTGKNNNDHQHNNHHVIYKPWHTCRPYDNITFIIIACIFIPIPIPTHNKDGNQKYIGTLLSSQTTQSHHHTPP